MKKTIRETMINRHFSALREGDGRLLSICISALLSVSAFLTVIPQTEITIHASDAEKNLQMGYAVIGENAYTDSAATVYYGSKGNKDPIAWRVIGYEGTGIASATGNATLLASDAIVTNKKYFDFSDDEANNRYATSYLHDILVARSGILRDRFTNNESVDTVLLNRELIGKEDQEEAYHSEKSIRGVNLPDQKLWPLSTFEAKGLYTNAPGIMNIGKGWWLRSPGQLSNWAAYINTSGEVKMEGCNVGLGMGVRPALNFNLSSVFLTSAAEDGKNPEDTGIGELKPVSDISSSDGWKLTLKDDDSEGSVGNKHKDFEATVKASGTSGDTVARGGKLTVTYKAPVTGENEYISAILVSSVDDTTPLCYARIAKPATRGTSTVDVTIPAEGLTNGNYTLKVYPEQYNGPKRTDLAGNIAGCSITITDPCVVKFYANGGKGKMADQIIPKNITTNLEENGFTYEGKVFKGWSETADGDVEYTDQSVVTRDSDSLTLYASWLGPKITTTSPDKGKVDKAYSQTLAADTSGDVTWEKTDGDLPEGLTLSADGTISGTPTTAGDYAFTVKVTDTNGWDEKNLSITIDEKDKCTITFKGNGGKGKMDPQKAYQGDTVKLAANKFTRSGYTFENWNTKENGSGKKYDDKASVKLDANMTLYAQWKEIPPEPITKYTVTVKVEGEGEANASPTSAEAKKKITIKAVPKAGHKFKKWKVTKGVDLKDVTKASTSFTMPAKNVTVTAVFEKIYKAPQVKIEAKGDDKLVLAWFEVKDAQGYDIFISRCNHGGKEYKPELIKTIKGNKTHEWTVKGLERGKSYKAYVSAYVNGKNGKKKYISKSPMMHIYTAGGTKTYTYAKSVELDTKDGKIKKGKNGNTLTLNVKDTYKIKASVKKANKKKKLMPESHVPTLRYRSSDPGIASVSSMGKITANRKGSCKIYVYAHNGVNKTIKLTVKKRGQ